mgnify:CR=1 FL=1
MAEAKCIRCEEFLDGQRGPTCRSCGWVRVIGGRVRMADVLDYLAAADPWDEVGLFDGLELT